MRVGNEVDGREGGEVGEKQEGFGRRVLKVGEDWGGGGGGVEPRCDHNTFQWSHLSYYNTFQWSHLSYYNTKGLISSDTFYTTHPNFNLNDM